MNVEARARAAATSLRDTPVDTEDGLRRLHGASQRRTAGKAVAAVAVVAIALGMVQVQGGVDGAQPPASPTQELVPMDNGRILQPDNGPWTGTTAPPPPTGERSYSWSLFDQRTAAFLYVRATDQVRRMWVLGQDGQLAEIDCPASLRCGQDEVDSFGPDSNEITVPTASGRAVQVLGYDGRLRESFDISAALRLGDSLSDLAWSPDGTRLAVSTSGSRGTGCDGDGAVACVWVFSRRGGVPVPSSTFAQSAALVHAEREADALRGLAWSPDGGSLALVAGPGLFCGGRGTPSPRLLSLDIARRPGQAMALHRYANLSKACVVSGDYDAAFPFAWSPDGTRIAVTAEDGIIELSVDDGAVLARSPGGSEGPLAWLAKR